MTKSKPNEVIYHVLMHLVIKYLFSSEKENSREVKLDHKNNRHWPEDIRKHNSELNTTSIGLPTQEKKLMLGLEI